MYHVEYSLSRDAPKCAQKCLTVPCIWADLHSTFHKNRPCLRAKSSLLQIRNFFIDDVKCFPIFIIRLEKCHWRLYEILRGSTGVRRLSQLNDSSQHKTFWERIVARRQHFIELEGAWLHGVDLYGVFWHWSSGITGSLAIWYGLQGFALKRGRACCPWAPSFPLRMAQSVKMPVWEGEELRRKEFSTDLLKTSQITTASMTTTIIFLLNFSFLIPFQQHGNN